MRATAMVWALLGVMAFAPSAVAFARRPRWLVLRRRLAAHTRGPLVRQQLPPQGRGGRGRPARRADRGGRRADRRDLQLDRSFSGDGRRTVNFGGRRFDVAYGLAVRGRSIVATGSTVVAAERAPSVAVARLTWSGGLARGFGRRRALPSPGGGIGRAVLAEPGGRILVGGRAYSDTSQDASDWTLLRFEPGGRLDRSFGGDGIVVTDFGTGEDSVRALAMHDGRILAAGFIYSSQGLARYLP